MLDSRVLASGVVTAPLAAGAPAVSVCDHLSMSWIRLTSAMAVVAVNGSITACGSGARLAQHPHKAQGAPAITGAAPVTPGSKLPTPPPTGAPAAPAAVAVIRAWSETLQRGDVRDAARYFSLPSELINGGGSGAQAVVIRSFSQAVAANASLPCGAVLISTDQRGRYVNALFRLTNRKGLGGGSCDNGVTARTNFVIEAGKIKAWLRAPDDPGDNGTPAASGGAAPAA